MNGIIKLLVLFVLSCSIVDSLKVYDQVGDDNTGSGHEVDVAKVVLSLIICIFGLFGNLVAIFVILVLKEYEKSVTHWYVLQLAFADSLFLLTLPFKVSEDLNNGFIYPEWMCKAKETILFLNYYASILFLMIMSIDRYIAVCHTFSDSLQKLRKRTSAFIIALFTWSASLLLCIPVMLYSYKIGASPNCKCSYEFPTETNQTALCIEEGFKTQDALEKCLNLSRNNNLASQTGEEHCKPVVIRGFGGQSVGIPFPVTNGSAAFLGELTGVDYSGTNLDISGDFSGSGDTSGIPVIHASCHYWERPLGWIAFIGFNFAVMFVLPLIVMIFCYGLIVRRLSVTRMTSTNTPSTSSFTQSTTGAGSTKKRKKSSSRSDKDRRRVTIMCAALVASFVICWLPFHANHLAKIVGIKVANPEICEVLPVVGSLLAYLNSALNPYLYSFLGTNFTRRWKMLKKSRGFQHFVSMAAWKRSDNSGGGNYQGNSRMYRKANASQNSRHFSASGHIQNQLPTMTTKASSTKYNESQAPLPPQSVNLLNDDGVPPQPSVQYVLPNGSNTERAAPVTPAQL